MRKRAIIEKSNRQLESCWSAFRAMWTMVLFDLPIKTKTNKRDYARFRRELIKLGFTKMQFSVYYKHSPNGEKVEVLARKIKTFLPPHGEVRILHVTARQFSRMEVFYGKKEEQPEKEPRQLELF